MPIGNATCAHATSPMPNAAATPFTCATKKLLYLKYASTDRCIVTPPIKSHRARRCVAVAARARAIAWLTK